jgi:hypothetical protein
MDWLGAVALFAWGAVMGYAARCGQEAWRRRRSV